jgi:hypothetical protein
MLAPTLAIGAALALPRVISATGRRFRQRLSVRRGEPAPPPSRLPIEQLAADLRRLLERHHALKESTGTAMRAQKLRATEAAITDLAVDAAQALDLPCPERAARAPLTPPDQRRRRHDLAGAGLVLEPLVGQFAADDHP